MQNETKICQNCKNEFVIETEDFLFYEKIKVPPPTFCPECRTVRRLTWRNEMNLYKRKCDAPGHDETLITLYPPEAKVKIFDIKYWWGDTWDALEYGREYDFSKDFFSQWNALREVFPMQSLSNSKATNSDYCNIAEESKDSYMSSASWNIERVLYSNRIMRIKDSADLYVAGDSELCYDSVYTKDGYNVMYSLHTKNCVNSYFLYDCYGCTDCFGCTNLRNKSYCMWNEQLSKEEYTKRLSEINLKSYKVIEQFKQKFQEMHISAIHRFAYLVKTLDVTGDNLEGLKNCKFCFDADGKIEDSKYVHWAKVSAKDVYDSGPGVGMGELMYDCFDTGIGNFRNLFTSVVYSASNIEYCFNCYGSSNLFGCIGLRNKSYCILNKQYTKEQYEVFVSKIKKHMSEMPYIDRKGKVHSYGEFFPSELSPFSYNDTVAQDYFPLSKERAIELGYAWHDKHKNEYQISINAKDLPDSIDDVPDSITKEIIGCIHEGKCTDRCAGAYRITNDEFLFYKRFGIPVPRLCFGCRHDGRLKMRNPMHLWHRACMCEEGSHGHMGKCPNEFETAYAPERPEVIYCESCYQKEVI